MTDKPKRPRGRPAADEPLKQRTIRLSNEDWEFCKQSGDASNFIRRLIAMLIIRNPKEK